MIEPLIKIDCSLTEKQYRRYMTFHVLERSKSWLKIVVCSVLIFIFGMMNFKVGSPVLGWIFVTLAAYLLFSRFIRFFTSVNRIVLQYQLSDTPKHFYSIVFFSDGLTVANDKEFAKYEWSRIHKAYFRKDILYLYLNEQTAFLIPYDGIEKGSVGLLYSLINDNIDKTKIYTVKGVEFS